MTKCWVGPYVITKKMSDTDYRIQLGPKTKPMVVHANRMKEYRGTKSVAWFLNNEGEQRGEPSNPFSEDSEPIHRGPNVISDETSAGTLNPSQGTRLGREPDTCDDNEGTGDRDPVSGSPGGEEVPTDVDYIMNTEAEGQLPGESPIDQSKQGIQGPTDVLKPTTRTTDDEIDKHRDGSINGKEINESDHSETNTRPRRTFKPNLRYGEGIPY